ncbi:MAG: hypothetical protein JW837_13490 [Sedimentisphaerales bacterium]|nr:hypothetical protein [Sedimentisphaerales bacterium]
MKKKLLKLCAIIVLVLTAAAAQGNLLVPDNTLKIGGQEIAVHKEGTIATLSGPGDYSWWHGCSPTSAGMLMGYYDARGYDNLVQGGAAENSTYGSGPYLANSAIASAEHISDFYSGGTSASGDDSSQPWHNFNCLADFMGTSQDSAGNPNGYTTFYYFTNGAPFTVSDATAYGDTITNKSGMYGIYEYIQYAGYDVVTLYNQYIDAKGRDYGFTYAQYMDEIDAGRPVLIHVDNHTMFGYGYDSAANSILLHDTWTQGEHSMVWGGSYNGLSQYGVTVLTMVPEPMTICLFAFAGLLLRNKKINQ